MNLKRTGLTTSLLTAALLMNPAQGQLVDTGALEPVTRAGQLPKQLEHPAQGVRLEALKAQAEAEAALDPVARALRNPLAGLPDALPIVGASGEHLFDEVTVEGGWRAVAREWLVWATDTQIAALAVPGVQVIAQENLPALGLQLVRLRVAPELDSRAALERQLPKDLHASLDRNHTYASQGHPLHAVQTPRRRQVKESEGAAGTSAPFRCDRPVRVGMVDTAVQTHHPAFSKAEIVVKDFLPAKVDAPVAHGTAVAGLLVGQGQALAMRLPSGQLFAASAFYGRSDYSQGATTQSLIQALNWLVAEGVMAINLSLAGPPNKLLGRVVEKVHAKQIALVAAVGNAGPASPPLYPAAFEGVVGVTAVDAEDNVYRWANQGEQVDFAALGVSVITARAINDSQPQAFGRESGTSMAAPVVTARMACELAAGLSMKNLEAKLNAAASDLGEPGKDPVFGAGLLY